MGIGIAAFGTAIGTTIPVVGAVAVGIFVLGYLFGSGDEGKA